MSVAFRRDSDEEHLEPKFEIPLPTGPNLVTPRGLALIEDKILEINALLEQLREESEVTAAKRDLRYWQARLASADVQPPASGDIVRFGSRVQFLLAGKPRAISIVGHDEADPAKGALAFNAPLSKALMGAEVGDLLDFNGQAAALEVTAIEPL